MIPYKKTVNRVVTIEVSERSILWLLKKELFISDIEDLSIEILPIVLGKTDQTMVKFSWETKEDD